jgi:hypothetical protein
MHLNPLSACSSAGRRVFDVAAADWLLGLVDATRRHGRCTPPGRPARRLGLLAGRRVVQRPAERARPRVCTSDPCRESAVADRALERQHATGASARPPGAVLPTAAPGVYTGALSNCVHSPVQNETFVAAPIVTVGCGLVPVVSMRMGRTYTSLSVIACRIASSTALSLKFRRLPAVASAGSPTQSMCVALPPSACLGW